jgi:threonine aldolase
MNFASDNVYGVHLAIMASLAAVNDGTSASYGYDDLSKQAEQELSRIFETEVRAFLVTTGTAANGLALSALTPPYGAIICHAEAHIAVDECNSPEMFTGGAKIIGLQGAGGKIAPAAIERTLKGFIRGEHDPKPSTVALTNSSELGTVYTPGEIKAIADLVKPRGLKMFMDGARFGNAVAGSGASPAELTWKSGVDALSFGGTKNGGMFLESVVFFDPKSADDFMYRRMRGGQLVSKSRYLAAQMLAYLKDGLWLENARQANEMAEAMARGLGSLHGVRIPHPVEANEVFAIIPRTLNDALLAAGARFYDWMPDGVPGGVGDDEIFVRFVLSFATPKDDVARFLQLAGKLSA